MEAIPKGEHIDGVYRLKIILSVFECNPYKGSDSYVGWAYTVNMARYHEVFALTRVENREDIERYLSENCDAVLKQIHFIYIPRSKLLAEYIYKLNRYAGFLGSYFVWQRSALRAANKIISEHDVALCHHVSIADFRCPGYLWKTGKPFVYGPVGGAQEIPSCLAPYAKGHEKAERIRSLMNWLCPSFPGYRRALRHASIIYSSNDETTECLSAKMRPDDRNKLIQMTELCVDEQYVCQRENMQKPPSDKVHIVVSGRLIYRKGVALLLDAVRHIQTEQPYVVDIYGEGDQKEKLLKQAQENSITKLVKFHGKVSFEEMQCRYREADIYVLPSLRETTGTAVFEAMANKLPVVALKQNGVKHIVEPDMGVLVDINSLEQVQNDLAAALQRLIENPKLRRDMGQAGYLKIREQFTWSGRVQAMNDVYERICRKEISF